MFTAIFGTLITLTWSLLLFRKNRTAYRRWRKTQGEVIGTTYTDTDDGKLKVWVVEFVDARGDRQRLEDNFLFLHRPRKGAVLPVLEHPDRPDRSVVDRWYSRHGFEALLLLIAVGFAVSPWTAQPPPP